MIYHVSASAAPGGDGSEGRPFSAIQQAADLALPGDTVLVQPGIYREWVDPKNGGTPGARITYRSAVPLGAVITGAEPVRDWKDEGGGVWSVSIPNSFFSDRHPFTTLVQGDWFMASHVAHLGDVFLEGKSMYEVLSREAVKFPVPSKASWDPEFSRYVWYTEQDPAADATLLWANFRGVDPNRENVEISVRKHGFYPSRTGVGYITLSGFKVCQAATQWAPPTAYQEGMVGPHWSKGWIMEDCEIAESKCSGISLGKYRQPENDNKWLLRKLKDGTQTERDCIMQAWREGWRKENVGSHIVRRCNIHDCGQTGIVGHLGGVFSIIEDNHIHHINNKQNLAGAEIGGIKMHAAIDVIFRRNHIHHCTRGIWLDWQAQGTRVTQNLFHDNALPNLEGLENPPEEAFQGIGDDVFIEVSHGPTLLDNNFFLSARAVKMATQGVAMVHNLICGAFTAVGIGTDNGTFDTASPRYTPYHVPHQTEVAGFMTFLHGDDRFYNNVFVQLPVHPAMKARECLGENDNPWDDFCVTVGTFRFDGYPTFEEWDRQFEGYCGMGSPKAREIYYTKMPVWAGGNVYFNGAKPWAQEQNARVDDRTAVVKLVEADGAWKLETNLPELLPADGADIITTATLGMAFEPEEYFENPDGSPITFDEDYFGNHRGIRTAPGPIAGDGEDWNRVLWKD